MYGRPGDGAAAARCDVGRAATAVTGRPRGSRRRCRPVRTSICYPQWTTSIASDDKDRDDALEDASEGDRVAQRRRRIRPVLVHYGAGEPVPAKYRAQNASRAAHRKRASSSAADGSDAGGGEDESSRSCQAQVVPARGRRVWRVEPLLIAVPRLIGSIKVLFDDAKCVWKALDALDNRQLRLIDALRNRLNTRSSITAWNMALADSTCYTNPPNFEMSKAKICGTRGSSSTPVAAPPAGPSVAPILSSAKPSIASTGVVVEARVASPHVASVPSPCVSDSGAARSSSCGTTTTTEDKSDCMVGTVSAPQVFDGNVGRAATAVQVTLAHCAGAVGRSEEVSAITVDNVGCKRRQGPR